MPATTVDNSTVTQVASSVTSVTLKAANTTRRGMLVYNDSTAVLYLKFGSAASTTSYTVQVPAGALYELPMISPVFASGVVVGGCYSGIVTGIWASANGNAYVTEVS